MKFLVPNYSCLQNPWLAGYRPQIPVLSVLCPQLTLLTPPEQNSWVRHCHCIPCSFVRHFPFLFPVSPDRAASEYTPRLLPSLPLLMILMLPQSTVHEHMALTRTAQKVSIIYSVPRWGVGLKDTAITLWVMEMASTGLEYFLNMAQWCQLVACYSNRFHFSFCLGTVPQSFEKPVLPTVRPSASSFNFQDFLFFLRSFSSCLLLLPRRPVTYIIPSNFPSIMCVRRQFPRKM